MGIGITRMDTTMVIIPMDTIGLIGTTVITTGARTTAGTATTGTIGTITTIGTKLM
jgi:hypothetical protein